MAENLANNMGNYTNGVHMKDEKISQMTKLYLTLDKSQRAMCLFLDSTQAFDTVNHLILLNRLNYIGIKGNFYNLLKNYFTNPSIAKCLPNKDENEVL